MKANMGNLDRGLRVILAMVFAAFYFTGIIVGTWGLVLLILGIVFLLTSFISFCPLYLPFGIRTNKNKK